MVLVCQVILQDHMTKRSRNIMGRSPSRLVTILVSFVIVGTGSGDVMVLVCHVILQDHVIKGSCDFTGRSPSRLVSILSLGLDVMESLAFA